jgi:NAD binding domain of 6-phosphogluconate dehydrogenase
VREVIDGIARHLRPGATLIEASTIGPQALEEVAALLPGSVALVDAPVMGSADRAASGQLVVLAGGISRRSGIVGEPVTGERRLRGEGRGFLLAHVTDHDRPRLESKSS